MKRWRRTLTTAVVGGLMASVVSAVPTSAAEIEAGAEVPIDEAFEVAEGVDRGDMLYDVYGWPEIESDPVTGDSLIVYNYGDYDDDGSSYASLEVHARAVDRDGVISEPVRVDVELGSTGFDDFEPPSVTWNATNREFLVIWTVDSEVYGQIINVDGTRRGENFLIAATVDGVPADAGVDDLYDIEHVRAAWSAEHRAYVVTFKARGTVASVDFEQTILATVLDEDGAVVLDGDLVDVSTEEANDGVGIAYSETSDVFLIVWERQDVSELPGARVVSLSPSGDLFDLSLDTGVIAVSTAGSGAGGAPDVAWDSSRDRFGVAWRGDEGEADSQTWMNVVDPDGTVDEDAAVQVSDEAEPPTRARIAYSPITDEFGLTASVKENGGEVKAWNVAGDLSSVSAGATIAADGRARADISYGGGCFRYVWWSLGIAWGGSTEPDSVHAYFRCHGCWDLTPGSDTFDDVPEGSFFDVPVGWLVETEATTGTSEGVYSPFDSLTRGQLATLLWRLAGEPAAPAGSATFDDVTAGRFYDVPIGWLFAEGLTTGTSDTTYHPERPITRGELATFIWRLAGEPAAAAGSASFGDVVAGRFYDTAIGWMLAEGITTGTSPTTFEPDRAVTRGEAATFLYRYYGIVDCADLAA